MKDRISTIISSLSLSHPVASSNTREDGDIDVSDTLSVYFQRSGGKPIDFGGQSVQPIFIMKLRKGRHQISIRRVKSKEAPISGLRLKATAGKIEVNGQQHSEIILWADTSPEDVLITTSCESDSELKAWNVWRIDDLIQAWVGNAGLVVDAHNHSITLRCSDGVGDVDFDDFVVQIELKGLQ